MSRLQLSKSHNYKFNWLNVLNLTSCLHTLCIQNTLVRIDLILMNYPFSYSVLWRQLPTEWENPTEGSKLLMEISAHITAGAPPSHPPPGYLTLCFCYVCHPLHSLFHSNFLHSFHCRYFVFPQWKGCETQLDWKTTFL